jgi:hypothetical protein
MFANFSLLSHLVQKDADQKRSAFSQILGLAPHSTPSLHLHFIVHPVLFILFIGVKRVASFDHSSCIYHPFIHQIVNLYV